MTQSESDGWVRYLVKIPRPLLAGTTLTGALYVWYLVSVWSLGCEDWTPWLCYGWRSWTTHLKCPFTRQNQQLSWIFDFSQLLDLGHKIEVVVSPKSRRLQKKGCHCCLTSFWSCWSVLRVRFWCVLEWNIQQYWKHKIYLFLSLDMKDKGWRDSKGGGGDVVYRLLRGDQSCYCLLAKEKINNVYWYTRF